MKHITIWFIFLSMIGAILVQRIVTNTINLNNEITIIRDNRNISIDMDQAESSQRGYIITGKEYYLEPYYSVKRIFRSDMEALKNVNSNDPRTKRLEQLMNLKFDILEKTLDLRRTAGFDAARQIIMNDTGNNWETEFRTITSGIRAEKQARIDALRVASTIYAQQSRLVLWLSIGVSLLSIIIQFIRHCECKKKE